METRTVARITAGVITLTNIRLGVFYPAVYFHVYNPRIILTLWVTKLYWEVTLSLLPFVILRPFQNHSFQDRICHCITMAYILAIDLCWNTYGLLTGYRDDLSSSFIYCFLGIWSSTESVPFVPVVSLCIYLFLNHW